MKKLYFFAFVAASLLMTSCVVGLGDESNQTEITVRHFADLTAELEDDSSVYIENGKSLCWHEGDLLSAFYGITQNCQYKFNGKTGDNSGIFSVVPSNELATGNPLNAIYALYPYNAKAKISKEGIISCTLPSVQSYAENSLGRDANTMVAVTENTDDTFLKFKNVCGYLKIKLYGNAVVENVVLRGNNDEKIAGAATISTTYGGVPTITMSSEATTAVTLDCSEGVMLGKTADEATELWFVIPATTFEKGITVVVTDNKGSVSTISTSKCITIERNTIQPMEAMEFAGSLTLSQEQMSVSAEGGKYSVDIYTEYAYQASANVDWIEIEDGGCSAEYYMQYFTVKPNDTTSSREGVITICCDDYNLLATLTIVQEQLDVYGVVIENVNYIGQFDTADKHLYTVEQKVSGDLVKYDNKGAEISREAFSKDLNLEVTFNGLEDVVYIENSVEYGKVSLTASSLDGDKINNRESDEFIIKSRSMDYHFKFNEGEKITVSTLYDRLIFDDDEVFAYSSIDRVRYNSYEAKLNEAQTNEDYISYDIILYFNVYLNQMNPDGTVTENTYSVAVPYTRSYKRLETYTVVENIGYIGQFDTADKHLYTVEQKVSGDLVKYDNKGVEISREAFSKDLNLEVTFNGLEDVVYIENSVEYGKVSLTASSLDGDKINNRESDEFIIKSRSMDYHFKFDGGEKITVSTLYDRLIFDDDEVFAYSSIDRVRYNSYEAKLNEAQTNEDYISYDIILYFNVYLNQMNPDGTVTENTYSVAVPYTRSYKRLETYTVVENTGYIGQFDTADKHLYTVEQKVSGDLVKYDNKGVEISREAFSKDLNLEVTFDGPEDVIYVENSLELVEVSLTASSHDGDKINNRESDEFIIKSRSMDYHFKFDEGEKITVSTLYDRLIYNDEVFAHSAIDKVRYNSYEAQLNEAQTNEDYITYDIILYFNVYLNQKNPDGTVTENTYSVAVPYTRVFKHIKN